jgi:hypothetical protein
LKWMEQWGLGAAVMMVKGEAAAPVESEPATIGGTGGGTAEQSVEALLGMGPRSWTVPGAIRSGEGDRARRDGAHLYGTGPALEAGGGYQGFDVGADHGFQGRRKCLGNLPHPNIIPIHAMGEDEDGFPFTA